MGLFVYIRCGSVVPVVVSVHYCYCCGALNLVSTRHCHLCGVDCSVVEASSPILALRRVVDVAASVLGVQEAMVV